ncbi:type I polyketide synthase [Sphaerisporangium sp. TRM90804]|uniref:type I polyketide synthase n=1 Tax=Sphaerisporangium sp. TRM90804 TaxID=3031113 RepID=UPI00244D664F|nr:type I polyketide synthase [Sphaerisporangium sp. TRM90804]MDH2427300.1 beta-ketoacyl synthase N-terminal-like domain-containing protein [Sphaerisporangium sp. TRM90804]
MTTPDLRARLIESLRMIERLRGTLAERGDAARREPVAVIGAGCRLPGGVDGPESFWRLLREGRDTVAEFPADRADLRAWYDPDPDRPGTTYVLNGSFVDGVDRFEPEVFGISPREAIGMDPQQRLVLEVTWEALEHAGYAPDALDGSPTGVFLGVSTTDYVRLRQERGDAADVDAYQLMGEPSFTAGRVSFTLGLTGPSKVVDTACSSSLVALHDACQALSLGECDMALAGGVNLMLSPYSFVLLSKFRGLAPDGRCKTFDAAADGYGRGEGAGVVVLKRLADAERDGDDVLAVVRGTAVRHDGRSSGMTVPNPASQQAVIAAALERAGLDPGDLDYVEAHGTGTALGDPIELRALQAVVGRAHTPASPLLVGSVKTNIGHLEAAAGVAGLLKLVLSLRHGEIPPHLHFTDPNPNVDWSGLNIQVVEEGRPWPVRGSVRAGGVSGFGASGTNAHAVLTGPPPRALTAPAGAPRDHGVLTLSARTETALRTLAGAYATRLEAPGAGSLADVCRTSQSGRSRMAKGLAVTGDSPEAMARALGAFARGERDDACSPVSLAPHRHREVAWLFTGQGSQYGRMGRELRAEPVYREALDAVAELMDPLLDQPLAALLDLPDGSDSPIHRTGNTQPALFAVQYALARLWSSWGVRPAAVMGHSVGEITAACVAGVLSLPDAVRLVAARARLMQGLPEGGVMATLVCDEKRARRAIEGFEHVVSVAAVNGPADTVIAGPAREVGAVTEALGAVGVKHRLLKVSHAFHSPLLDPILDDLRAVTGGIEHHEPAVRLVSNVTGAPWGDGERDPEYWVRHAVAPVRFLDGIRLLHGEGMRTFVEIGPQPVLLGLGARGVDDPACLWVPSLRRGHDGLRRMVLALGSLHLRGVRVDWAAFHGGSRFNRVPLPTHVWDRERHWFRETGPREPVARDHPRSGPGVLLPVAVPTYRIAVGADAGLAELTELAHAAAVDAFGGAWRQARSVVLREPVSGGRTVELSVEQNETEDQAVFTVRGRGAAGDAARAPWRVHARGVLRRADMREVVSDGTEGVVVPLRGRDPLTAAAAVLAGEEPEKVVLVEAGALSCGPGGTAAAVRVHPGTRAAEFLSEDGRVTGRAAGLRTVPAAEVAGTQPWHDPAGLVFDLEWREADLPVRADLRGERWLLLGAGGEVAGRLAGVLRARGAHPRVVSPPPDAGLPELIRSARPHRVVVLTGLDAPALEDAEETDLVEFRDGAELLAVTVMRALHAGSGLPGTKVHLVTSGAVPAGAGQDAHSPAATPLWGLGRVFALEHPALWGGAVDLDPGDPAGPAEQSGRLADALAHGDAEDQIALRGAHALVCRLVPRPLSPDELRAAPPVRPGSAYLVTGGFGGIGTTVARWLAGQGARRLVLMGRTPMPGRERWDDAGLPEAQRARIAVVRELEAAGAEVEVVVADVADAAAVRDVVGRLSAGAVPLRGVIHAAGVSAPQIVTEVDRAGYDAVWRPKVIGGWALHRATEGMDLDFFLGFSSIAAAWGSLHLAGYAAANAFLDGLAHHRVSRGLAGLSVDWGQWELPSSLYGEDVRSFLAATGLRPLPAGQGLRLMGALLAAGRTQPVVCAADWATYKPVLEVRGPKPVLALIEVERPDGEATGEGASPLLGEVLRSVPERRLPLVSGYLRDQLAQILRLDRSRLDDGLHLLELGIDSLMVMELISRVRRDLGVACPTAEFFATDAAEWDGLVLRQVLQSHEHGTTDDLEGSVST